MGMFRTKGCDSKRCHLLVREFSARPQYKKLGIINIATRAWNTPERWQALDLWSLDVASVRMATPTICCRTPVRDPVLVKVNAARETQSTPSANLDLMVCKFLRNQVMLNVTPPPGGRFRVDSKVITMRQKHST
ncbi:hypothetical protein Trydic_g7717 [Trypoxylus dichotomus]